MAESSYEAKSLKELRKLAKERGVSGAAGMSSEELAITLEDLDATEVPDDPNPETVQEDPWMTDPTEEDEVQNDDDQSVDPVLAALDPANPGKTGQTAQVHTEPQVAVRTPEGETLYVDANRQQEYEEMGFEVILGADKFGPHGTITAQADEHYVAIGEAETKAAEAEQRRRMA